MLANNTKLPVWPCNFLGHYHKSSFTSVHRYEKTQLPKSVFFFFWQKTASFYSNPDVIWTFLSALRGQKFRATFSLSVMTHSILLPHLWNESEMPHVVWRESFLEVPPRRPWLQVLKPYVRKPKRWGLKMPFVAFLLSRFSANVLVCVHVRDSVWVCTCQCSLIYQSLFCHSILLHHI